MLRWSISFRNFCTILVLNQKWKTPRILVGNELYFSREYRDCLYSYFAGVLIVTRVVVGARARILVVEYWI